MRHVVLAFLLIAAAAVLPSRAAAQFSSDWKITVASGPHAGTYKIESGLPCSKDNPTKGTLATGYDRGVDSAFTRDKAPIRKALKNPKSLNWMQLYAVTGGSGTGKFTVYFGPMDSEHGPHSPRGTRYEVETRSGKKAKGSGTFTVKPSGRGAVITFDGTSAQGVKLNARTTCSMLF